MIGCSYVSIPINLILETPIVGSSHLSKLQGKYLAKSNECVEVMGNT